MRRPTDATAERVAPTRRAWLLLLDPDSWCYLAVLCFVFFSSRRRHTSYIGDWSSDVCSSDLEKFLDTPVKRYSSGMYVRLAFAVAAHLEPEILIIDEVLAVGDASFQEKCLGKMKDVAASGRTVLFVSHNMVAIRQMCTRGILLNEGKLVCESG